MNTTTNVFKYQHFLEDRIMSIIEKIKYNLSPKGFVENFAKNMGTAYRGGKFIAKSFKKEFKK